MAFRAVSFDLFDTLVDLHYEQVPLEQYAGRMVPPTARALHAAVAERSDVDFETFLNVAFAVDQEIRGSRYARDLELPTEERFAALVERLGLVDTELPGIMTDIHMGAIRRHTAVPEHHAEILIELKRRVRIGLCSNFSHSETALSILEEFDLLPHFDAVVISETVGIRKPRAEIFAAVLEGLGVAPGEVLHVGDSLRADVDGAAAFGIPSVWITRRISDADRRLREHEGAKPDFVIRDLAELSSLLDRCDG
jgi:HAD superfamily hydrolase (TIGR01509 family)